MELGETRSDKSSSDQKEIVQHLLGIGHREWSASVSPIPFSVLNIWLTEQVRGFVISSLSLVWISVLEDVVIIHHKESTEKRMSQSTIRKKMATGTFTYNALPTKTLKERIKTQSKIASHSNSTRAMLLV